MKQQIFRLALSLLGALISTSHAATSVRCDRLETGDTFDDLNKILDCIEAKSGTGGGPLVTSTQVAVYGEESEPNNRIGEANRIALGTTVTGRLKDGSDIDMFTFVAPESAANVRIILRQTDTTGFYPAVKVYDDTETIVLKPSADINTTLSAPLEVSPAAQYFITINCWQLCGKNMPYELLVRAQ